MNRQRQDMLMLESALITVTSALDRAADLARQADELDMVDDLEELSQTVELNLRDLKRKILALAL